MATEIERKFLVSGDGWRGGEGTRFSQGYLTTDPDRTVRVRLAGEKAWLTLKGRSAGISRSEFEYEIPVADAVELLKLCLPTVIDKTRYCVDYEGHTWEIDVFHGENDGLIVAEVELESVDVEPSLPEWIGEEVSENPSYFNSHLSRHPYRNWE